MSQPEAEKSKPSPSSFSDWAGFYKKFFKRSYAGTILCVFRAIYELSHQLINRGLANHNISGRTAVQTRNLVSEPASDTMHHDIFSGSGCFVHIGLDYLKAETRGNPDIKNRLARDYDIADGTLKCPYAMIFTEII